MCSPKRLIAAAALLIACGGGHEQATPSRDPAPAPGDSTGAPAAATAAPTPAAPGGPLIADHTAAAAFKSIPAKWRGEAKELRIVYGTLSHGSQITHGANLLGEQSDDWEVGRNFMKTLYGAVEPRKENQAPFDQALRKELSSGDYDVAMYAWSGGIGREEDVPGGISAHYLAPMQALEAEFPKVRFVYFTGPARGEIAAKRNEEIRAFARANGKALFDFEAIDRHDPSGADRGGSDTCEWCDDWCAKNDCSPAMPPKNAKCAEECVRCRDWAHTHCFNCLRKAQAFWWLMARLAGWPG